MNSLFMFLVSTIPQTQKIVIICYTGSENIVTNEI